VAFRAAARLPEAAPSDMEEVSGVLNTLTAHLLSAGMPLEGNEIYIRVSNAIGDALANVLQGAGKPRR